MASNPITYLARKTWRFSEGTRGTIVLYIFLFIIANSINFFEPLVVGALLNTIQNEGFANMHKIIGILSLFVMITVGFWIFHGPARVMELSNSFRVAANYRQYLLEGVLHLDARWHEEHHSGDTYDKIDKAQNELFRFARDGFMIIETLVRFISSYIALIYFNLASAYIIAFFTIIAITTVITFDKIIGKNYKELFRIQNSISAKIYDAITNITTIVILRIERLLAKGIWKKILEPFPLYRKTQKISETKWFLVAFISSLMLVLVIGTYIYQNRAVGGAILVGTIYALYGYVQRISDLFFRFTYKYADIVTQQAAVENVEEITKNFSTKKKVKAFTLEQTWRELHIHDLSFSHYGQEGELHLHNLQLRIGKREKIALIGESGSGKTTFLKLLRGIYEPKHMELEVDGKKIPGGFSAIGHHISLVPQEPELFTATIEENITLGIPLSRSQVQMYARMASFHEVAMRLPHKYGSSIKEKGVNLSGGEKQRLALTRGLLASRDKEIVLLDEPTSSVDSKNEAHIYENLFTGFREKTIISAIHRLHLLPKFDTIYLFSKGRIIGSGSFDGLMKSSPEFRRLWKRYQHARKA